MKDVTIQIHPDLEAEGIEVEWEDDAAISITVGHHDLEGDQVLIAANSAGLRTFAEFLLTLADEGVPTGRHLHVGEYSGLLQGSTPTTIERSG